MAIKYRKIVRSGADITKAIENEMGPDPVSSDRWSEERYRMSLNEALEFVGNKLRTPFIYTLGGDQSDSTSNRFRLPDYIEGPLDVQRRTYSRYAQRGEGDEGSSFYHETVGFDVVDMGDSLWLEPQFFAGGDDLRLVYWPTNPPYPPEEVKLLVDLDAADTSMVLDVFLDMVGQNGFLNVGGEIIRYSGIDQGVTTTLLNLTHSINGMVVATHTAGAVADFCVATHDASMYQILKWWAMGWLHGTYLNRASQQEREMHDMQQRLYIQLAKDHLRDSWHPARSPRMRMDRVATQMAGHDYQDFR